MTLLASIGRFGMFAGAVARSTVQHGIPVRQTIREAYRIGIQSLPILLIIAFFVGTNLSLQGYSAFRAMGGESLVGMFVALAGVRELAPVMVGAMVAAKAGTEMASQLAVMRIREQIDALEVMAIDPYWYLITPRFLGIVLVLPALTVISIFTLICSAWLVAVFQLGLSSHDFIEQVIANTHAGDLLVCSIKAASFGVLISLVSCFHGFNSPPGPSGVGAATNAAVVVSAVGCAILNYFISELVYG